MKPINFNGATHDFGKPKDWDEDEHGPCAVLPVVKLDQHHMSLWKPNTDELSALARGGYVLLTCLGGQPPVSMDTVEKDSVTEIA